MKLYRNEHGDHFLYDEDIGVQVAAIYPSEVGFELEADDVSGRYISIADAIAAFQSAYQPSKAVASPGADDGDLEDFGLIEVEIP